MYSGTVLAGLRLTGMFTEPFPGLALEELVREALAGLRSLVGEPEFLSFRGLLSLSLGGRGHIRPVTARNTALYRG